MAPTHSILASDDETLIKFIGVVVVLIIWGISSLLSAFGKARQKALKNQQQNRASIPPTTQRPPVRPAVSPRRPAALPPLAPRTAAPLPPLRTLASPPRQVRPAVAKTAPRPSPKTLIPAPPQAPATPAMRSPSKAPVVSSAVASLLRPKTVRAQFILAEVLQPPLALRTRKNF